MSDFLSSLSVGFVWSLRKVTASLNSIEWLIFVLKMQYVFRDVNTYIKIDARRKIFLPYGRSTYIKIDSRRTIFLPYGRSIGSWTCLTHNTYTCHTVQNTYSASMAISDSQSVFRFNLSCFSYSALFRFLSRMRCTSMGVWGSMIY
jgi:hypothetical protein